MTNRAMRQLGADAHLETFKSIIRPYALGNPQIFMDALADSNAVIIGSAALSIILRTSKWKPRDLNIAVPLNHSDKLHDFLLNVSYNKVEGLNLTRIPSCVAFTHMMYRTHQDGCLTIIITESTDESILQIILSNEGTPDMLFATPQGFFCAHPNLTFANIAFRGFTFDCGANDMLDQFTQKGFLGFQNVAEWGKDARSSAQCSGDAATVANTLFI
ncbi:hypothetical protein P692DRAFT_20877610 [Suillus brevipes Sb2]|nr:hypothetical protein P692DRAFT_20877610 [Suillus brevipes Sb2]